MKQKMHTFVRRHLGRLNTRIIMGYFLILLLPFLLIFNTLINDVNRRSNEQRQNVIENAAENYRHIVNQYVDRVLHVKESLMSNTSLQDMLLGNAFTVSDEVYTYNRHIGPLFQYLLLTNDIESIIVYRAFDSHLEYNQYFSPIDRLTLNQEDRAYLKKHTSLWKNISGNENEIRYVYYSNISYASRNINLGVLEITIDLTDKLSSLIEGSELRLEWRDRMTGQVFIIGDDENSLPASDSSDIFSSIRIDWPEAEIILRNLASPTPPYMDQALIVCLSMLGIASVSYYLILWKAIWRISKLTKHITLDTQKKAITVYENSESADDEIGMLIEAYNSLIRHVNSLIETQYVAEIHRQRAENYALQMQINPHFLYNVLECIRMTAYEHNDIVLNDAVYTLSRFMHYNFSHPHDEARFSEEIEHIRQYFSIMFLCMEDKFEGSIEIEPGIRDFRCPFFILQPIVENSFTHGLKNQLGTGKISIRIFSENGFIVITVCDNGCGIVPEELEEITDTIRTTDPMRTTRVGLSNVHSRMKQFFGDAFEMNLSNADERGAMTMLKIPVKEEHLLENTLG